MSDTAVVKSYFRDRIVHQNDKILNFSTLFEDYSTWCSARGHEPVAPFFLVQQFSKLKIKSTKIQGKVFFVGVHLREFIIDERTDTENGQRTQIAQFLEQRIVLSESSTLTATELYLEYCHWCKARNNEPLVLPTFGRLVGEYGLPKAKVSGRIRYVGVAIAATPHDLASIPSQGLGTKFRQGSNGRIEIDPGSTLQPAEHLRLDGLHKLLKEAAQELVTYLAKSNGYRSIQKSATRYFRALDKPTAKLTDGDIELLYGCGLALDAARETLKNEIAHGEAPAEDIRIAGPLSQLLGLHGPFIQSTDRGNELYDQTDRDRRPLEDDLRLKELQSELTSLLAEKSELISASAIEVVEGVTDTMGSARNPDRAGVAGRRLIGNLWSAIAGYAVQAPRTIALTTAGAIFHATPTGAKIIAASAPVLEIAMVSGGSIALQAQAFISQNAPLLLALAEAGGPRLEWLSHFIQSFKSARAQSLIQSQGVAGKTRPGA